MLFLFKKKCLQRLNIQCVKLRGKCNLNRRGKISNGNEQFYGHFPPWKKR